jgi:hypothetical protein
VETNYMPSQLEGLLWGILPVGSSLFALFVALALPDSRRVAEPIVFPSPQPETAFGGVK